MFLTSKMNFMEIGHDFEVLWRKFKGFFGGFGVFFISTPNFRQEVAVWCENLPRPYLCIRNPKKKSQDDLLTPHKIPT